MTDPDRLPPSRAPDDWGAFRTRLTGQIADCADYLGRIRRSVAGIITGDRAYVAEKSRDLSSAARYLARFTQDVEGWLTECGAEFEVEDDGYRYRMQCEWPAGHAGAHAERALPPVASATEGARRLADEVERVAERLGWLAPGADADIALGRSLDTDDKADLDELAGVMRDVATQASRLASDLARVGPRFGVTTPPTPGTEKSVHRLPPAPHRPAPDGGLGL